MTIKQKIEIELKTLHDNNRELYDICYRLNNDINTVISEVSDHLSKIQTQMPDYDKHSKEHSEKVIENIELLLQEKGISELTLLEAMLLELCGYFHDTGMALPDWGLTLFEKVEDENYQFHNNAPISSIKKELLSNTDDLYGNFERIKNLFLCPETEPVLLNTLAQEVHEYEQYRMGLSLPITAFNRKNYIESSRQEYLRSTHGRRAKAYAKHINKKLSALDPYDANVISESVGNICCGHCEEIESIWTLKSQVEIVRGKATGNELTYNEQFLALLLRLGDVIHFSEDRTSRTLYAEHTPMNAISDSHWQVKINNLHYHIVQKDGKTTIAYFAGFQNPQLYYFLHDYLDWVDNELQNYAAFVQNMEQSHNINSIRYRIGLPTKVDREGIKALGYFPDSNLKFRLEQKKVIQLLMGLRLYSDEFICLRELYQNSLDSCRCMQAQNKKNKLSGILTIEFGISTDDGGEYIYCRDEGTGMTKNIVMKYLLRVGNSYYNSPDFKRENAAYEDLVNPISEFGIGILSCYMIGNRIDIITKHYSNDETCWVCMEGTEDYGFFREVTADVKEQLGNHGTIVKIYLSEQAKEKIHANIPDNIEDIVYIHGLYQKCKKKEVDKDFELYEGKLTLSEDSESAINLYKTSLYHRMQKVVFETEDGISVCVADADGNKRTLIEADKEFSFAEKYTFLINSGFKKSEIFTLPTKFSGKNDLNTDVQLQEWLHNFLWYRCKVVDEETKSEAYSIIHLPTSPIKIHINSTSDYISYQLDHFIAGSSKTILVDGMPILGMEEKSLYDDDTNIRQSGIRYNFKGKHRPILSVDRENIREIPKEVTSVREKLTSLIIQEIAKTISDHLSKYECISDLDSMQYIDRYLNNKFDLKAYCEIMHALSKNAFSNYPVSNIPLKDIFTQEPIHIPDFNLRDQRTGIDCLLNTITCQADKICIDGDSVSFTASSTKQDIEYDELEWGRGLFICVNEWTGKYSDYDIVSKFLPLLPEKTFQILDCKKGFCERIKLDSGARSSMHLVDIARIDPSFKHDYTFSISRSDILLQLDSNRNKEQILSKPMEGINDEDHKKYVLYTYISPRNLSEEEELEITKYAYSSEFIRGIHEGWSILFYRYSDGYLVAPGIVAREKMVEQIPSIAKNHNDGITYCFTDGTKAF